MPRQEASLLNGRARQFNETGASRLGRHLAHPLSHPFPSAHEHRSPKTAGPCGPAVLVLMWGRVGSPNTSKSKPTHDDWGAVIDLGLNGKRTRDGLNGWDRARNCTCPSDRGRFRHGERADSGCFCGTEGRACDWEPIRVDSFGVSTVVGTRQLRIPAVLLSRKDLGREIVETLSKRRGAP